MFQKLKCPSGYEVWINFDFVTSIMPIYGGSICQVNLASAGCPSVEVENSPELQALLSGATAQALLSGATAQAAEESPKVFAGITGPGLYLDSDGSEVMVMKGDDSKTPWCDSKGRWFSQDGWSIGRQVSLVELVNIAKLEKE